MRHGSGSEWGRKCRIGCPGSLTVEYLEAIPVRCSPHCRLVGLSLRIRLDILENRGRSWDSFAGKAKLVFLIAYFFLLGEPEVLPTLGKPHDKAVSPVRAFHTIRYNPGGRQSQVIPQPCDLSLRRPP